MDDEQLRRCWLQRMRVDLPAAAAMRPDWPVRLDHCFARIILDTVCGRPWREVIAAPAWRNMTGDQLRSALALADAILNGDADLNLLDARSLHLRGKPQKVRQKATTGPASSGLFTPPTLRR